MLNDYQYEQLLKPLNPSRVAKRQQAGRNLSYLEAWDVKAHLNRIFGFLNWSADVISADIAFEDQNEKGQWQVGYKVVLCLRVNGASYTEAAVGSASLPQRGEAHDMAVKTAESDALKRAAINLGTQFGLSLYDDGSMKDVVGKTLDRGPVEATTEPEPAIADSDGTEVWIEEMKSAVHTADIELLLDIKKRMSSEGVTDWVYQGVTLSKWLDKAIASAGKAA
jgi:hypothetical protein